MDFKKAFDTVNHKLLLKKLRNMKIENLALKWISTYLSNRSQSTIINDVVSNEEPINTGVPQGSILGPLFFLCYINDITSVCKNSHILLYADDTVMYKSISDSHRLLDMNNFQQDVNRLIKWCQLNRLSINIKKTKLVFHPHKENNMNNVNSDIMMGGIPVDYVSSYLYLGVDIDNMLTFKKHFVNTFKNVSHKLFILRKTRHMINIKAALDITKTMLCSVIDYGNIFLSSCTISNLNDLQVIQNHAIRCVYNIKNPIDFHINELHIKSNIKFINTRRKKQILTCYWRNIEKGVIKIANPVRETRSNVAPSIYLPVPKTEMFKKSVYYYGATLWNALPFSIRVCDNIDAFKLEINKLFVD